MLSNVSLMDNPYPNADYPYDRIFVPYHHIYDLTLLITYKTNLNDFFFGQNLNEI